MTTGKSSFSPQDNATRIVSNMMSRDYFSQWLGIEVLESKPGSSKLRFKVREEMLNGFGVCHGGVLYAVADSALAFAANAHGVVAFAINNSIQYPEGIREGEVLTVVATERKSTRKLGFYNVDIFKNDGTLAAIFNGTVYKIEKDHVKEER